MPKIQVPIANDGPILELSVWTSRAIAHAMVAGGRPVPAARTMRALLDTGSDLTVIHPLLLQPLSPVSLGSVEVSRPGMDGGFYCATLHKVRVAFAGPGPGVKWIEVKAVGLVPATPGVLAIIGRDLLAHCRFLYDGFKAEITLAY